MKCATLVIIAVSCIFNSISAHRILSTILSRVDNRLNNAVPSDPCSGDHRRDFENALTAFSTDLFKRAATISGNHFVISPHSIWLSLAVIAEGADKTIQSEYFRVLNLPKEFCVRKEYYRSALDLETSGSDVKLLRKRVMIFGNDLQLNAKWVDFVRSMKLLELTTAAKNASLSKTNSHTGKSLLLDTLDYEGLWTTAFPEADIKRSPFYDDDGKHIGDIELMRIKMKVRMAHLPISKVKVLELPVGKNGTYTMLITMGLGNVKVSRLLELYQSSFIVQILNKLIMSIIPIDIAIPKFTVHTKYDARKILEDIGLKSIWFDPAATRLVAIMFGHLKFTSRLVIISEFYMHFK